MNQQNRIARLFLLVTISIAATAAVFAQSEVKAPVDANYDITLQLVIGSNEAGRSDLPSGLTSIGRQIKENFGFANQRVASTFLGRLGNHGNFEYKSLSNVFGQDAGTTSASPTFLDWSVLDLRSMPTAKGTAGFQAQSFRFGARVPVLTGVAKDDKIASIINYEAIGVGLNRIGLSESVPTLIGTLNLPGTSGTLFLVMTVRPVD